MQLSEFVKILYPYLANGSKPYEFLRELLDYITDGNEDKNLDAVYDMTPDFLNRIYNGKINLPRKRASVLLSHLDKLRFSSYVDDRLTIDAAEELRNELLCTDMKSSDTPVMCADIFTEILREIASPTKKKDIPETASQVTEDDILQRITAKGTIGSDSIFTCFELINPYFGNYFSHGNSLYYPEHTIEEYLAKLVSNTAIVIKGRQGSGKTTLALKLAELFQLENPCYRVMYTNISADWYSILTQTQYLRRLLPNSQFVWVIDDIHRSVEFEQEIVNWPFSGIDKYIFVTRNSDKTKGNPYRAESSKWDDESVIKLDIDNITFAKYLYADPHYVSLTYRDVEKIFSMCGGDLTLLEKYKILYGETICAHCDDEQDMLRDVFSFYFPNSRFTVQTNEFTDALKMLVMGMLDYPIPPSLQNYTCNTILAQFCHPNIKGELEFEHASIAELLFSCITNYLQLDFILVYESLVREISRELISPTTRKDAITFRVNAFLQSMLTYRFTLPINRNKTGSLHGDASNEDAIFILQTHTEFISASTWKLLVNDKTYRNRNIELFINSIKNGGFIQAIINSRDYNFRFVYRVLSEDMINAINDGIICNVRTIATQMDNSSVFVLLLRSLKDDTAICFLEMLDQEVIMKALSNNDDGYFGLSCGLRYLHDSVNEKLEERIGEENLEKMISTSSMSAILQFLEYFTIHRQFLFELVHRYRDKILENQISSGYSVRRISEIQSIIKRTDPNLLESIENAFAEDFYLALLEGMGNIQDLYDLLASCTSVLRTKILDYLQEDSGRASAIFDKAIASTRSIGTLNLSLKALMKESTEDFERLNKILGYGVFIDLISNKGNIMDLLRIVSRLPTATSDEILDVFMNDSNKFSMIVERTIEDRVSLGTMGLVLYDFDDVMLAKIEELITAKTYMELCRRNGNLPILMGIMQHSSAKMQIELAEMLKQNQKQKDELLNNTIEDEKKIGTFALCLKSLKDENEESLVLFEEAIGTNGFLKLIGSRGNIVILSRFLQYMSNGMREKFMESLKKNPMSCDTIFENTFVDDASAGTFHFALRDMSKQSRELLQDFEHVLGASRYLRIICELGNLTVLFQILQYSTPDFMDEIAKEFEQDSTACEKMIERTIMRRVSIRALPLPLKEINKKNPSLMELLDRIIGADNWIELFIKLGDIMTVLGCLPEMSRNMRVSILRKMTERHNDFATIVSNTVKGNISLGTLPLRIKYINMSEPDIRDMLETLFTPEVFMSLMEHQGKLSILFQSLGEFSTGYLKAIQEMELHSIIDKLFQRSLSEKDCLVNTHYGFRNLAIKNYELLYYIESYLGRERFKQLFIQGSSLFNVLRIAAYSTLGMELCDDVAHDEEYFDILYKSNSGNELSNGFELEMHSAIMRRNSSFEYVINNLISDKQWVSYFEEKCSFHAFLYILRWLQGVKIMHIADIITSDEEHLNHFREKWREEILVEDKNTKFAVEALEVLKRHGIALSDMIAEISGYT